MRLARGRAHAARAGRGLLLGLVAGAAAGLSRPSADGRALDPARHRRWPARRRWACGCSARLRRRRARCCWPTRRSGCFPGRRLGRAGGGAAERDADARRRRGDDDAGHAAAVLRDADALGAGAGAASDPRWWLLVGAAAGLALDSKYTGALLGRGDPAVAALDAPPAPAFRSPWLWAGGGAGRGCCSCR